MKFYNKIDSDKTNKTSPKHFQGCLSRTEIGILLFFFPTTWHNAWHIVNVQCYVLVLFLKTVLQLYLSTSM